MTLPKTKHPLFDANIPSTKKLVWFRQMLVADEKILLLAKASGDDADINRAVKQVVNNCLQDSTIDSLTTFDIEYMFLKIRSVSIGSEIELSFQDKEDDREYNFVVNLDDVEIKWPELVNNTVKVDDTQAISLRYPPASLLDDKLASEQSKDAYEFIASKCIDKIFDGDEVYEAADSTDEELLEYIHQLPIKPYNEVRSFLSSTPHLFYEIQYTNEKGSDRKIPLTTLTDFFTLR